MNNYNGYVARLEHAILLLLPIYTEYYKEKGLDIPELGLPKSLLYKAKIPAILKENFGVLESTSNRLTPRKN